MKQYSARLLVVLCIVSFSPIKEVMKAPLIVVHYLEHLTEYPQMTWEQFYFMHYTVEIHFDEDYEHDRQLPFKSFEYSQIPTFLFSEYSDWQIKAAVATCKSEKLLNDTYLFYFNDAKLRGVFHPPQIT